MQELMLLKVTVFTSIALMGFLGIGCFVYAWLYIQIVRGKDVYRAFSRVRLLLVILLLLLFVVISFGYFYSKR
jgi:hypothetical protein